MRLYLGIGRVHFLLVANVALLAAIMLAVASPVDAQESSVLDLPQATTDSEAEIPVDHLQIRLRPLTKDELEIELNSWLNLLRAKIREVGDTELKSRLIWGI